MALCAVERRLYSGSSSCARLSVDTQARRLVGADTVGLSEPVEGGAARGQNQTGSTGPEVNAPFISPGGTGDVVSLHPRVLRHAINRRVTFELKPCLVLGTFDNS